MPLRRWLPRVCKEIWYDIWGRPVERRLAAILAADVVGYSRLIGADESGTQFAF
jgi:class 3 adenylate cyclase